MPAAAARRPSPPPAASRPPTRHRARPRSVLYELCTLRHAFSGDNLVSLIMQIIAGTYPSIPDDRYDVRRRRAAGGGARPALV